MMSVAGAADLPMKVKAPAVQYVKICSIYGAGFYYIPGTDTCLKIGGHIRVDMLSGPTAGPFESLDYNQTWTRATRKFNTRVRAYATFDTRSQTQYGTLRSYFVAGGTTDNGGAVGAYMYRAFIQFAGFTWGLTDSIFDSYAITPIHMNDVVATNGNIGATGIWQWRYTAQFGNGFSASVAAEEPTTRAKAIAVTSVAVTPAKGVTYPDIVGQIEASGGWGRVQAAVALSDISTQGAPITPGINGIDKTGWAGMVGGILKIPGMPGDTLGFQFTYAKGATGYVTLNANTVAGTGQFHTVKGNVSSNGFITDAVVTGAGTSLDLTKAWGFEVGYEHHWSKFVKTSLAGGYVSVEYSGPAAAVLCAGAPVGCNPDTKFYNIGSRTQWTPVENLNLAVDIMYTHINGVNGGVLAAGSTFGDANIWTSLIRVSRDFWP
jgi:hypothetical protein